MHHTASDDDEYNILSSEGIFNSTDFPQVKAFRINNVRTAGHDRD